MFITSNKTKWRVYWEKNQQTLDDPEDAEKKTQSKLTKE